jgi:hypothetical protein
MNNRKKQAEMADCHLTSQTSYLTVLKAQKA